MKKEYREKLALLKQHSAVTGYYFGLQNLVFLDNWTGVPAEGRPYRKEVSGFLAGDMLKHQTSDRARELIDYFEDNELDDPIQQAMLRDLKWHYRVNAAIPPEEKAAFGALTAESQPVWAKAMETSDYSLFKPYLKKIFLKCREFADRIGFEGHPINSLAAQYEMGIDAEKVDRLFADLKKGIISLLGKIQNSKRHFNGDRLDQPFPKAELFEFIRYLVEKTGYDVRAGGYGESVHPFSAKIGPRDARITLNCTSFRLGVFGGLHEAGHGIYVQNSAEDLWGNGLWGGILGSVHESQSRFYENIIGKSQAYWQYFYPEVKSRFPIFKDVGIEEFYHAVNRVQPTLRRITADEVTYNFHPIIRWEIEKEVLEGNIGVDDLPKIWNEKYKQYLGIEPESDREGVLQDPHWATGVIGFFQSYTLANIYGGQFLYQLRKDIPDVFGQIRQGNFQPVNAWLKNQIHRHSKLYTPDELIQKVTGEELSARYFLDYLNEKYSEIYSL